jgi:hypothetical protein
MFEACDMMESSEDYSTNAYMTGVSVSEAMIEELKDA